ncbi:MAG: beta strand repeat-containing protein [Acidimicrobiales bacterium]
MAVHARPVGSKCDRSRCAGIEWERAVLFGFAEMPSRRARAAHRVQCGLAALSALIVAVAVVLDSPTAMALASTLPTAAGGMTYSVTNGNDSGAGSLRQAILDLNSTGSTTAPNTIGIAAGIGSLTVEPTSALPAVQRPAVLNGGGILTVNGTLLKAGTNDLTLSGLSGGSLVTGLTLEGSPGSAIVLKSAGDSVCNNTIGGVAFGGDGNHGGILVASANDTIGCGPSGGNEIVGNLSTGITVSNSAQPAGTRIQGNYIGTDQAGDGGLGNVGAGIYISGSGNNTIGGSPGNDQGNVICGNGSGVLLKGSGATGNLVEGNLIGTNGAGTGLPNGNGVVLEGAAINNTIGGAGLGNVISGNSLNGVVITGAGTIGNVLGGNFIGTNEGGSVGIGNDGDGVLLEGGVTNNTIGGSAGPNLISGNSGSGVLLLGTGTSGNLLSNNLIGTNEGGNAAIPNHHGVVLEGNATNNTIGGGGGGNLISGNSGSGVLLLGTGTSGNLLSNNLIGTNGSGTAPLGEGAGVLLLNGASNNTIGTAGDGNVISGINGNAVTIGGTGTNNNLLEGNSIGTDVTGSKPVPNLGDGVLVYGGSTGTQIGGSLAGDGNIIANNNVVGVLGSGPQTTLVVGPAGQEIYSNGKGRAGPGLLFAYGANRGEPSPAVTTANTAPATGATTVTGTAQPNATVDVYSNPSCADPEGAQYLGSTTADGSGDWTLSPSISVPAGSGVTAIETSSGVSSAFSTCVLVSSG